MLENLTRHLSNVVVKEPSTYKNLSVFPLFGRNGASPDYLTLDEAMTAGSVSISETSRWFARTGAVSLG